MIELTLEQLFAFAVSGVVVSLVLEFFPFLHGWYNDLPDNVQKGIVLVSGGVVVAAAFALSCLEFFTGLPWTCSPVGFADALIAYLAFIFASQGTYLVTPRRENA